MKAIYSSYTLENEITAWVVSFFFVVLGTCSTPAVAWQDTVNLSKVPATVRARIEQASPQDWEIFVAATKKSILGTHPSVGLEVAAPPNLTKDQRLPWISMRLVEWTRSPAFVEHQLQAWLQDRSGPIDSDRFPAWNFQRHEDWIRKNIDGNESFLTFMQRQLAGASLTAQGEDNIATASWFRTFALDLEHQELGLDPSLAFIQSSRPTPERLPISLKWSDLSHFPGVVHDCSQETAKRLQDIEAAMESVLNSEQRDWQRILIDEGPRRWHGKQIDFPRPDPMELTFDLSAIGDEQANNFSFEAWNSPWRHTEPWSVILELEVARMDRISSSSPITLLRQIASDAKGGNHHEHECAIVWDQGSIQVRLSHAYPQSYLAINTPPIIVEPGRTMIAIVYDGLPTTQSLRVWSQGKWQPQQSLHDVLLQDFATPLPQKLEISRGTASSAVRVNQVECYRSALTELELKGWTQESTWKDWGACTLEEQYASREHWAKRVDLQWRYQRESLLFYANSFATALARCSFMPILDPSIASAMPISLANGVGIHKGQSWNDSERVLLAKECEGVRSTVLAMAETERQWQQMIQGRVDAHASDSMDELRNIAERFRNRWDRRELILDLVLSDAWTRIAIASTP
ncbi:MAG: hypothetical protein MUF23_12510 [Pirellula sp.]|jgi:hypothetical protein|nr:hypothetical protein [Pirellula sp.]